MGALKIIDAFIEGWLSGAPKPRKEVLEEDKALRDQLSNKQVDKMVADSFPASDPPSTY